MANPRGASFTGTLSSELFTNATTITLLVGESAKPFNVPRTLLISKSGYFARRYSGWDLYTDSLKFFDANLFSFVVEYIYTSTISHPSFSARPLNHESILSLISLWKMADDLSIPGLQNLAIKHLHHSFAESVLVRHVGDVDQYDLHPYILACYEGTPKDCPLRRWISDLFACGLAKTKKEGRGKEVFAEGVNKEFLMDVLWRTNDLRADVEFSVLLSGWDLDFSNYLVEELQRD